VTDDAMARRKTAGLAGFSGDITGARSAATDPDPSVREAALRSLDRLGSLSENDLDHALADPHPRVRVAAIELAAPLPHPPLAPLLHDDDPRVVEMACWACGERDVDPQAPIATLVNLANDHDDPLVREAAVAALGAIGAPEGLPAILHATTDKPAIRRRAVLALAAFDGPEVDAAWARARTDRDRQVRDAVEELLGPTGADG
jgi:HEAT repeat protein